MNKIKKSVIILLLAAITVLLTSCYSPFASPGELMSAPKFSGELSGIDKALSSSIKGEYSFVYPLSGDYRSSCVSIDLDNDKINEALVFYSLKGDLSSIHFNLLKSQNGVWKSVCNEKIEGTSVEKVEFADICANNSLEIIIDVNMYTAYENTLCVYTLKNNEAAMMLNESCTDYCLCSLLKKAKPQIMLFSIGSQTMVNEDDSKTATTQKYCSAKLIKINDSGNPSTVLGTTALDPNITDFSKIIPDEQGSCVYIDAFKGSEVMITELVKYSDNSLINEFYDVSLGETVLTKRENPVNCLDVDKDGTIEFPQTFVLPSASDYSQNADKMYYTSWKRYENGVFNVVTGGFYSAIDSYFIALPQNWAGAVSIQKDTVNRTRAFYKWDLTENKIGDEIFTVRVVSKSVWKSGVEGFEKITEKDDTVYAVKLNTAVANDMGISLEYIKNNFILE